MKKFTLIIFLLISGFAYGQKYQEGFVVTYEYDTISGYILRQSESKSQKFCVFKEVGKQPQKYSPTDILSYGTQYGRLYLSNEIGLDVDRVNSTFVRVIVDADVPLYEYDKQFAFRSPTGQVYMLLKEDNFYKQILNVALVPDCFVLSQSLNDLKLSRGSLAEVFQQYNRCAGNPYEVYLEKAAGSEIQVSLGIGFSSLKASSSFASLPELDTKSNSQGIDFAIKYLGKSKTRLSFASKIQYLSNRSFLFEDENSSEFYATKFNYNSFRLSVGGNYEIIKKKQFAVDTYVGAGVAISSINNQTRATDIIIGSDVFTSNISQIELSRVRPIFDIDLTLKYYNGGKYFYFFNVSNSMTVEQMTISETEITLNNSNLSLNLGIGLPLD